MAQRESGGIGGLLRGLARLLPLGVMALIFFFSSQTGEASSKVSGGLIESAVRAAGPAFGVHEENQIAETAERLQFIVRKSAHAGIYCALGVFTMLAMLTYPYSMRLRARASALVCALYAVSDEVHQLFVPGRSGEVRDVFIDTAGAAAGILLVLSAALLWKRWNKADRS